MTDPIRPTDDDARANAQHLLAEARFGALAVIDPDSAAPFVSRVALGTVKGALVSLVSSLSQHTRALRADPRCSVLVGEPGPKGDPLTHARLTVQATAEFVERSDPAFDALRQSYLIDHPKAALYIDFTDFCFVRFLPSAAHLNGGFGKAYALTPADLAG